MGEKKLTQYREDNKYLEQFRAKLRGEDAKGDIRKYLSLIWYYGSGLSTEGKQERSCAEAGYQKDHARIHNAKILGLDRFADSVKRYRNSLAALAPRLLKLLDKWLQVYEDKPDTPNVREAIKLLRMIGESIGAFVKLEAKVESRHEIIEHRFFDVGDSLELRRKKLDALELAVETERGRLDDGGEKEERRNPGGGAGAGEGVYSK